MWAFPKEKGKCTVRNASRSVFHVIQHVSESSNHLLGSQVTTDELTHYTKGTYFGVIWDTYLAVDTSEIKNSLNRIKINSKILSEEV